MAKRPLPKIPSKPDTLDLPKDPTSRVQLNDLPDLFKSLVEDVHLNTAVDEVTIRICCIWPAPRFQAVVKFRDRGRPWATFVHADPMKAFTAAMFLGVEAQNEIETQSTAMFHLSREKALEATVRIKDQFPDLIIETKVELEPIFGWVGVVFVPKGSAFKDLEPLAGQVEVRELDTSGVEARRRGGVSKAAANAETFAPMRPGRPVISPGNQGEPSSGSTPVSARKTRSAPKPSPDLATSRSEGMEPPTHDGSYAGWKKSALIKEHQRLFGKQPNNKLSAEEIIAMIQEKLKG